MRKIFLFLPVLFLFTACVAKSVEPTPPPLPKRTPKPGMIRETVKLLPVDGSDQSGYARVEDLENGSVRVLVRVDKAGTSVLPASLNNGECDSIREESKPLQDVKSGNSDTLFTNTKMTDIQTHLVVVYYPDHSRPTLCGLIE